MCRTGGKGPCHALNVIYKIACKECDQEYIGETARNAYSRGKEHLKDLEDKNDGSVLWKHAKQEHQGRMPEFSSSIVERFENDALLRQISESVKINRKNTGMNSKTEWNL